MKYLITIAILLSLKVTAGDRIEIKQVFVTADGRFAFESTSFPSDINSKQSCNPNAWSKSWFGFVKNENSEAMVSVILSAQARGKSITINASGCIGDWHKVTSIYSN